MITQKNSRGRRPAVNPSAVKCVERMAYLVIKRKQFEAIADDNLRNDVLAMTWLARSGEFNFHPRIDLVVNTGKVVLTRMLDAVEKADARFFSDMAKLLGSKSRQGVYALAGPLSPLDKRVMDYKRQCTRLPEWEPQTIAKIREWVKFGHQGVKTHFDDKSLREALHRHSVKCKASPMGRPRKIKAG
jgi:hypothetical protein